MPNKRGRGNGGSKISGLYRPKTKIWLLTEGKVIFRKLINVTPVYWESNSIRISDNLKVQTPIKDFKVSENGSSHP